MAETLVEAFPYEEESVRGALREKYNSLLHRLRQSSVLGMNNCLSFNFPQEPARSFFHTKQRRQLSFSFLICIPVHSSEGEGEEADKPMRTVIQDKRRHRRKHLGRLRRHLAPTELHLWMEKEGEEERGSKRVSAVPRQPSSSKSPSDDTLANDGFPPVCSDDGDTADALSEATSPDPHSRAAAR